LTINEISVVEAGSGEACGVGRTFVGLYAPQRNAYHMEFPPVQLRSEPGAPARIFATQAAPGHLVNQQNLRARNLEMPELRIRDGADGLVADRFNVKTRSTQRFEVQHRALLGGGLRLTQGPDGSLAIQNQTGRELLNGAFIRGDRALALEQSLGRSTLAPGENVTIPAGNNAPWKASDEAFFGRIPTFRTVRGQYADNRARSVLDYLRGQREQYPAGMFCAWLEGGALPVAVGAYGRPADDPGRFEGLTLLIVPAPVLPQPKPKASNLALASSLDLTVDPLRARWVPVATGDQVGAAIGGQQSPPASMWRLRITLPDNFQTFATDGYNCVVQFILRRTTEPSFDGSLVVRAGIGNKKGIQQWQVLNQTKLKGVGANTPAGPIAVTLPLVDYRLRTGNAMYLDVEFQSADRQHNYSLEKVQARLSKE
jgi:hypothetical protein